MKASVKRWWLQALRSERYEQVPYQRWLAVNSLCSTHSLFSPLGVLCDIYTLRTNLGEFSEPKAPGGVLTYKCDSGQEEMTFLPPEVADWADLENMNPRVNNIPLTDVNDAGWSFNTIANMIEEYL